MARTPLPTATATIYRLRAGLRLQDYLMLPEGLEIEFEGTVDVAGVHTHVVAGVRTASSPDWGRHIRQVTGLDLTLSGNAPFAVMLVPIDATWVCAVTWGGGRHLLDDLMADEGFGLAFAIRRLDPTKLRTISSSLLDVSARTRRTSFPTGSSLYGFGVDPAGDLVNGASGPASLAGLTYHDATGGRPYTIRAGDSLAIPIGRSPADFIADLRAICEIADGSDADSPLRSISQIRPLATNDPIVGTLESRLAVALGGDDQFGPLGLCWPTAAANYVDEASSFATMGLGNSGQSEAGADVDVETIVDRFVEIPELERILELKNARLVPCADEAGRDFLTKPISLHKWIAFETTVDNRTYCLHQGRWFVVGQDAVARVRAEVAALLANKSALSFPTWVPTGERDDEHRYCELVADMGEGYLCLDRSFAKTGMHQTFELADIVGPADEQVHVKWLGRATAASHLFTQARISAWSQRLEPEALQQLDEKVRAIDATRRITERPLTVVLAIAGRTWHVDKLFTLSMIGLLRLNDDLRYLGVELQFADIPFVAKPKNTKGAKESTDEQAA